MVAVAPDGIICFVPVKEVPQWSERIGIIGTARWGMTPTAYFPDGQRYTVTRMALVGPGTVRVDGARFGAFVGRGSRMSFHMNMDETLPFLLRRPGERGRSIRSPRGPMHLKRQAAVRSARPVRDPGRR